MTSFLENFQQYVKFNFIQQIVWDLYHLIGKD